MYCVCWCDLDPIQGQGQGHGAFELLTTSEAVHAGGDDCSPLAGLSGFWTILFLSVKITESATTSHHNHFTALLPGPPRWAGARRELLVQGKIDRGRRTDHPQLRATPSGLTSAHVHHPPLFFYRPDALPAAQPTASKHWRQTESKNNFWYLNNRQLKLLTNGKPC